MIAQLGDKSRMSVGEWLVTPTQNLLECGGRSVRLEPRAMQVLICLVERAGEVISTDELIASVWKGLVVGDSSVYHAINQLRRALGDDREDTRFIQTIPKQGYRLIAPVSVIESTTTPEPRYRRRRSLKLLLAATGGLGLVLVLAMIAPRIIDERPASPTPADRRSIAVLPFENVGTNPEYFQFPDAVHNDLVTYLSKIGDLKVISRSSTMEYQGTSKNLRQIGAELGVESILQGTVQRVGDTVRVNVQLADVETGEQIWGEIYERELTARNMFALQTEMSTEIAGALQAALTPEELIYLTEVPTESAEVWDYYRRGNDFFKRADDRVYMPSAVAAFEQAVTVDPEFALGWAGLSSAHSRIYWYELDRSEQRRTMALEAVQRAFDLAPGLPEAHIAMSIYHQLISRDYDSALAELALAEKGMPGAAELFETRGFILRRLGEWERAAASFQRALELDPLNVDLLIQQSIVYQYSRRCSEATENLDRVLTIASNHAWAHYVGMMNRILCYGDVAPAREAAATEKSMRLREFAGWTAAIYDRNYATALAYLDQWDVDVHTFTYRHVPKASYYGVTYSLADQPELAEREFRKARAQLETQLLTDPEDARLYISLGEVMFGLGRREEALTLAHRAMDLMSASSDVMTRSDIRREAVVRVFAPAGDIDTVITELDTYLSGPGQWSLDGLLVEPRLDPVRDHPRFLALVERYR